MMVFQENFYTYRLERQTSAQLALTLERDQARGDQATAQLSQIELHMTRGHELYRQRKYQEALGEYKLALGLVYQLTHPRFPAETMLGWNVHVSALPELFRPLLDTVFTVVEKAPDSVPPTVVQPPSPVTFLDNPGVDSLRGLGLATEIHTTTFRPSHPPDSLPRLPSVETQTRRLRVGTGIDPQTGAVRVADIPLADAARSDVTVRSLYEKRVTAGTLDELGQSTGPVFTVDHFRLHIPHHYLFTLQMCLGDTYKALGQHAQALNHYGQARDYQYLNRPIEAPAVWLRLGRCLLDWGYSLYRNDQVQEALDLFRQIVVLGLDGALSLPASSPLYGRAPLHDVEQVVAAFIATMDGAAPAALNPEMAIVVRQARVYQEMIHAGLNVLGLPLDLVPVFRFRYLHGVARFFTEQAIKAEREYVNFIAASERETAALLDLQHAYDLAKDSVTLEDRRVDEAKAQVALAEASRDLAQTRKDNAAARKTEYESVSADKVALDTASAHASGGFTETEGGGYQVQLASPEGGGTVNLGDEDYEILRAAAWHRGQILRTFELNDMQRTIDEYDKYVGVADKQVAASEASQKVAEENQKIAVLRRDQAQESLDYAKNKTFDAELWHNLGDRMRELAQLYLDRATEIAFLMQAAYNFEMDAALRVIRSSYATGSSLGGLLGGDGLLADIDYFTYHHITQTKAKEIPLKTVFSLAARYPFTLYQLRRTGQARFETRLEDFDDLYPGSYLHKIKAVEVVVEGLVSADGLSGSLKNSGVSAFRSRDGGQKVRVQPRETLLLSAYSLRPDSVVFRPSSETLDLFEGSGAATAWTLEIPPDSNDLDYQAVSDVKLILYYTAYYDQHLEDTVRAALPAAGARSRGFSLRFNAPDAFFLLLEQGTADFTIDRRDFPYNQIDPKVQRLSLCVIPETGFAAAAVTLAVANQAAGHAGTAKTGVDGTVSSDSAAGAPLAAFHGDSLLDRWTLTLDRAANPTFFIEEPAGSGRIRVQGLRDLVLFADYGYKVRGR